MNVCQRWCDTTNPRTRNEQQQQQQQQLLLLQQSETKKSRNSHQTNLHNNIPTPAHAHAHERNQPSHHRQKKTKTKKTKNKKQKKTKNKKNEKTNKKKQKKTKTNQKNFANQPTNQPTNDQTHHHVFLSFHGHPAALAAAAEGGRVIEHAIDLDCAFGPQHQHERHEKEEAKEEAQANGEEHEASKLKEVLDPTPEQKARGTQGGDGTTKDSAAHLEQSRADTVLTPHLVAFDVGLLYSYKYKYHTTHNSCTSHTLWAY